MFKVPEILSLYMGWGLLSQRSLLMPLPDPGPSLRASFTSLMEVEGPRGRQEGEKKVKSKEQE